MSSTATLHRSSSARSQSGVALDALMAVGALAGSLLLVLHGGFGVSRPGPGNLDGVDVALTALTTVPLVAWRRAPLAVFVLTASANILLAIFAYPIGLPLGPAVALYLIAASRKEATPWIGDVTTAVVGLFATYIIAAGIKESVFPGVELLHAGLAWAVAWFAGERTRLRREQIAELIREAQRERLLAAAEERARIARDLHDSAGHAVNVIAVRAGAARLRHREDPDRSFAALEAIEELARQTVEEIDRFVGALREPDSQHDSVEPPPGLASLDTLVAHQVAAGLDVTLHKEGSARPLGRATDQAVYRILQEALTNASRHGAGTARIEVDFGESAVEVTVTNPVNADRSPRSGGGHGMIGMRERATMVGGHFDAERANGTFRVSARIPYGGRVS
jgi:signal transduction histidine kinase